jgi:hypothetical protein
LKRRYVDLAPASDTTTCYRDDMLLSEKYVTANCRLIERGAD